MDDVEDDPEEEYLHPAIKRVTPSASMALIMSVYRVVFDFMVFPLWFLLLWLIGFWEELSLEHPTMSSSFYKIRDISQYKNAFEVLIPEHIARLA